MAEHTKGPWVYSQEDGVLADESGAGVACLMPHKDRDKRGALFAVAPELLEALEQAERKLKFGHEVRADCVCFDCELLRTVRAAIAKAREGGR